MFPSCFSALPVRVVCAVTLVANSLRLHLHRTSQPSYLASEWLVQNIDKVSLSELSDNFLAVSVPSEYDFLIASTRKSEIVTVLVEAVKQLTTTLPENELQVKFSNRYKFLLSEKWVLS